MLRIPHSTVLIAGLVSATAIAPLTSTPKAMAQASFKDVDASFWAKPYIEALATEKIITGFPDGAFRPNEPVTRAQFAAIISKAFIIPPSRPYRPFLDVSANYWAEPAIRYAHTTQFLSGSPSGNFEPENKINKAQALVSIASGLNLQSSGSVKDTLSVFQDAAAIPSYAETGIAAATLNQIPVNYPRVNQLNPNQAATRADIAAFIYQALVKQGKLQPIAAGLPAASYIVQLPTSSGKGTLARLATGRMIPVVLPTSNTAVNSNGGNSNGGNSGTPNIVMAVGESLETTFLVAQDIFDEAGLLIIPKDSQIKGLFQPVRLGNTDGTQFTATQIIIRNQPLPFNASSNPIAARKKGGINLDDLTGSLGTNAASTVLQSVLGGGISLGALLPTILQVGGQLGQRVNREPSAEERLIIVEPDQLGLKLNSGFDGPS